MGSAAIVGDEGISASQLTNEVTSSRTPTRPAMGRSAAVPKSQTPQQVLSWLVRFRIREQMAIRNGVTVTPADSQRARRGDRGAGPAEQRLAGQSRGGQWAPPNLLPELGRYQRSSRRSSASSTAAGCRLAERPDALSQKFATVQCRAAKSLAIKVTRSFGGWTYNQLSVIPAATKLSARRAGCPPRRPSRS